jgi:hypothetical protein
MDAPVTAPPLDSYLPVGCLVSDEQSVSPSALGPGSLRFPGWTEVQASSPEFDRCQLEVPHEASVRRLLKASWLRLLARDTATAAIYRVFWLPNDVSRIAIVRDSRILQSDAELVLSVLLVSPELWHGTVQEATWQQPFDCFAQKERGSLFHIFDTLPSPNPQPEHIHNRFSRAAAQDILDHDTELPGLKTRLYPYQARSAAAMIGLESSTELHNDARFERRVAPDGSSYFFVPRLAQFYKEVEHYASNRGGILAENMGLG